jgi:hypothetical protein
VGKGGKKKQGEQCGDEARQRDCVARRGRRGRRGRKEKVPSGTLRASGGWKIFSRGMHCGELDAENVRERVCGFKCAESGDETGGPRRGTKRKTILSWF